MTFEAFERILKCAPNLSVAIPPEPEGVIGHFERNRIVTVGDLTFRIEWYSNYIYFYFNGTTVIVGDDIQVNGHWPNYAKTNLVLSYNGKSVAIVPLEYWEAKEGNQ